MQCYRLMTMFVTDRGIFIWYSTSYQLLGRSPVPACPTSSTSQSSCRIMYADRCILSCPHYLLHHLQMHVFRLFRDRSQMKRFGLQYWCSWKLQLGYHSIAPCNYSKKHAVLVRTKLGLISTRSYFLFLPLLFPNVLTSRQEIWYEVTSIN